jgi:hypothetical protein
MSSKDNKENDVLGKLDKVAITLETASNQLSGVVSQQQLDLVKERIVTLESEVNSAKDGMEILARRTAAHASDSDLAESCIKASLDCLERDFSGLRALTLSSFAIATIAIMGLIIYAVF